MTPEHELESEEDDEAPEELTFQSARSQEAESARLRREADSREKAALKEKRKRKQELFSEQKKKKLLSSDILQTLSSDQQPEPAGRLDEPDEKDNVEEEHQEKKKTKKLVPRKRLQDNYKVVHLTDHNSVDLQQQKAQQFLKSLLYGKDKNRTTNNEFFSLSRKKDVMKRPAVEFTDNKWETEEKKKAETFKLKWASRKKL